MLIEHLVLEM